MPDGMTLDDVRGELASGCRVLLFVRHAERPKIAYEDKTFGGELPLTANGERMSVEFGRLLAGAADSGSLLCAFQIATRGGIC